MCYLVSEDELYHYGVKGMKWGVRRYQNADGTYNSAGRSRYGIGDGKTYTKIGRISKSGGSVKPARKKKISKSSNKKSDSRVKKAARVLGREVAKPALKKAAIGAGIAGAALAGRVAMSRSPKLANTYLKVINNKYVSKATNAVAAGKRLASTPVGRAVGTGVAVVGAAKTVSRVHQGFKQEGVYKKGSKMYRVGTKKKKKKKKK